MVKRKTKIVFIVYLCIYLCWHSFYLSKYPLPNTDDVWLTEPVWRLFTFKKFSSVIFGNVYDLDKTDTYHGRLYSIFHFPILLFGLGIYQARLSSLIAGLIVLYLTFLISKKLFNFNIGILSTYFLSLTYLFINLTHRVRQEMALVSFLLLSFYFFNLSINTISKNKKKVLILISGLFSSLSIDIHLNGIIVVFTITLLVFLEFFKKVKTIEIDEIVWFVFGIFLGIFWWIYSHVFINSEAFFCQLYCIVLSKQFMPGLLKLTSIYELFKKLFYDYFYQYWIMTGLYRGVLEYLLIVGLVIYSFFVTQNKTSKYIAWIITIIYFLLPLFSRVSLDYCFIFYPFVGMLFGCVVANLWRKQKFFAKTLLIGFAVFSFCFNILPISVRYFKVNFNNYAKRVCSFLPANAKVFSDLPIWFCRTDIQYYLHHGYYFYRNNKNKSLKNFFNENQIEYLVLSEEDFKGNLNEYLIYQKDFSELKLELIGKVEDRFFGGNFSYCGLHKFHTTGIFKVRNE
ncbi:MAG: glycosyltransferase family 39 protein [Endomicrobiia bacterium]